MIRFAKKMIPSENILWIADVKQMIPKIDAYGFEIGLRAGPSLISSLMSKKEALVMHKRLLDEIECQCDIFNSKKLFEAEAEKKESKFLNEIIDRQYDKDGHFLMSVESLFYFFPKAKAFSITKGGLQSIHGDDDLIYESNKWNPKNPGIFTFSVRLGVLGISIFGIDMNMEYVIKRSEIFNKD